MTLRKYDELMDKIEVTEELRSRILNHIENEDFERKEKVIRLPNYKKMVSIAACFLILLAGVFTLPQLLDNGSIETPPGELTLPGIVEATSAKELSQNVGFEIKEIGSLKEISNKVAYTCFGGEIAEISYDLDGKSISFRKSVGTEDNSGDYNVYETEKTITVNSCQVTIKGYNEICNVAIWMDGEYAYSVCCSEGITLQEIQDYIIVFD